MTSLLPAAPSTPKQGGGGDGDGDHPESNTNGGAAISFKGDDVDDAEGQQKEEKANDAVGTEGGAEDKTMAPTSCKRCMQ